MITITSPASESTITSDVLGHDTLAIGNFDTLVGSNSLDTLAIDNFDTLVGSNSLDTLAIDNVDTLVGNSSLDSLVGASSDDFLTAGDGALYS